MGMIEDSVNNSKELRIKTKQILEEMIQNGEIVNFETVSKKASVSKVFLHKHKDIRENIKACRVSSISKKDLQKEVVILRLKLKDLENNQ